MRGSWLAAAAASLLSVGAAWAGPLLPGTEALNDIDDLVVVYPAKPEADAPLNKLSAERRAGFLHVMFGVAAEAVADDAVTEEQLHGNLLVLGWDNRVIELLGDRRPFRSEGDARIFLDGVRVAADQDLLFTVVSPHAPERKLFFWSRIDLDRDRFSVLPFLGSDWAVYRGYEVVRAGMLRDHGTWPLARNPAAESTPGDFRAGYPPQSSSAHYVLHHPAGLLSEDERAAILSAREKALVSAAAFLAAPLDDVRIELYLFVDEKIKEQLTGVPDPVHSVGREQELYMLPSHARSSNPHEETHLLAYRRLGPCYHTTLHEGLPLALERAGGDASLSTYAAALVATKSLPAFETLLDETGMRTLNKGQIGFPASGLFVSWILDRGGLDLLGKMYTYKPLTAGTLASAMGVSPDDAAAAYRNWVEARAKEGDLEYRFQRALADAAMSGQNGDWATAIEHLNRALELRPGDADTLYRLALAEDKAGLPAAAEGHLRKLLELAAGGAPVAERYVIFAHYQLGRVLDRQGHGEAARKEFQTVLTLPDRHGSHRMAQEALGAPQGGGAAGP
jgi:tetratricopeptide (TPR) repeat protein